jgi:DNA-directed RNA polymerase specialized sigma24 family protein
MINDITSSIAEECEKRLDTLYRESHTWLLQVSYNITKNREESEDLTMELYEYLIKKQNPKIFYLKSYNLMYCMAFLKHRWINKTKKLNRITYVGEFQTNEPDEVYDVDRDIAIMKAHEEVQSEIKRLKKTKHFAPAMIYEMYWASEDTLQELADKIGISKSTCFIHIKKIRQHLKKVIDNPFNV